MFLQHYQGRVPAGRDPLGSDYTPLLPAPQVAACPKCGLLYTAEVANPIGARVKQEENLHLKS